MASQTLLQFSSQLDAQLGWRKKEITTIAFAVRDAKGPSQTANARAAVCLLYAHWEGFIRHAAEAYLNYVAIRHHRRTVLSMPFRALIYRTALKGLAELSGSDYALRVEACVAGLGPSDDIEEAGVVRTRSNLGFSAFGSILKTLGLENQYYATKQQLIDESLLERRNNIAHGKDLDISPDDFDDLRRHVTDMMDHFAVQVFVAASEKHYLSLPAGTASG